MPLDPGGHRDTPKPSPFKSLRARLLALVVVALLPAFAHIAWIHYDRLEADRADITASARRIAASRALEVGEKIEDMRGLLAIVAGFPTPREDPRLPRCSEILVAMKRELPHVANLGVATPEGKVVCSAAPFDRTRPAEVADRLWYRRALETRGFAIGDYLVGRLTGLSSLTFGLPVPRGNGELAGVAFIALDLAWLSHFISELPLPENSALVVLDESGRILARHPDHAAWVGQRHPQAPRFIAAFGAQKTGTVEAAGVDGRMRLYAFHRVPGTHEELTVVFGQAKDATNAAARQRFAASISVMTAILLAAFALAWWVAERLVLRRAQRLSETVGRIAVGDLTARAGLAESDEIGRFATALDGMADAVAEREQRLERANRALRIINAASRELLKGGGEAELLAAMCHHIVKEGGYAAAWVGRRKDDEAHSVDYIAGEGVDDELKAYLRQINWVEADMGYGPVGAAIRENRPVVIQDLFAEPAPESLRVLAQSRGFAAAVALPIRLRGEVWGAISMYSGAPHAFRRGEIALLAQATDDLAIGLTTLRAQARELAAHDASRVKSDFLASMSHELRTPLNAIIGFSEVLRDGLAGEVTAQQREYLQDILDSGTHLLELINDILDLSKVEAGKMTLELQCQPVDSLLRSGLAIVREKAAAHQLKLELQVAEDTGEICADARKVKQIIYNLLSNAVKFTPEGGRIAVSAQRAPAQDVPEAAAPEGTLEFLEIAVADTGIGISAADQEKLFSAFTQIDSSLARRYEGTGLGLALVKRLTELHGGAVGLVSAPGQGSTFRVWLPYRPVLDCPDLQRRIQGLTPHSSARKVLVVEDDPRAAELLRRVLEEDGLAVTRAADAAEARARLTEQAFDLVTLDILLPDEDGWQFLDWLKKSAAVAHIPVVVISIVADGRRGISLGASGVLPKPFLKEDLLRILADLGFAPPRRARVLVVDDEPEAVERLALLLEAESHVIERASGGKEAVHKALASPPDLILLDLMMPDLSGFDVVTALRTDPRTLLTPIVVVTGKTLDAAERCTLNGYVQAVVLKNHFAPEVLLAEVHRALSARREQ